MNVIDLMGHHVSVRNFEGEPLSEETKRKLLTAAHAGSSSNFVQATSIIEITDEKIRSEIAEISQSAAYVKKSGAFYIFIADLYRQATLLENNHKDLAPIKTIESLLVSVIDTTIAAENMAVAAESLGLGICYIGGVRNDLNRVKELLHLPKYTLPLFGLTLGEPITKNGIKPRLPFKNFVGENQYNSEEFTDLKQYDRVMADYYLNRPSHPKKMDWSTSQLKFFADVKRPEVADFIQKQGFTLK
jgi:FMN reductase (NADPH)